MTGDDQERFEDYLELERYIEELQAGHVAHPPRDLTPNQAKIYRMAALFRSISPEAAEPRPEFVAQLKARLLDEGAQEEDTQELPGVEKHVAQEQIIEPGEPQQQEVQQPLPLKKATPKRAKFVSRRSLLAGGAVAAASLVAGAALGTAAEQLAHQGPSTQPTATPPPYGATPLVAEGVATTWLLVTTLEQLGDRAIRFVSDAVMGYVIRNDGDDGEQPANSQPVIAMSAACTHMGCIVQWNDSDRHFHCPCHGGLFTEYGKPDNASGRLRYLSALPRLNVKVENGKVYVEVPRSTT